MIVEKLIGEKAKIKILRFFFQFPLVKRNVREVIIECKLGYGIASSTLKELNEIGILSVERSGKEKIYSLNKNSEFYEPVNRLFNLEKRTINLPVIYRNLLSDIITKTKRYAKLCVLFGSLVTGEYSTKSDVDLFFVSEMEEKIREKCMEIEERYEIKIQCIIMSEKNVKKFKKSKLYDTVRKESFVLFGKGFFEKVFK